MISLISLMLFITNTWYRELHYSSSVHVKNFNWISNLYLVYNPNPVLDFYNQYQIRCWQKYTQLPTVGHARVSFNLCVIFVISLLFPSVCSSKKRRYFEKNIKTKNHIRYIKHIVTDTKWSFIVNFDVVFSKYHLKHFISYVCCIITQSFIKYFRFGTTFDTIPPFNNSVTLLSRFIYTFASENDKNIFFFKV